MVNDLLAEPAAIVAVDLKPAHIALTRLNPHAVQQLPNDDTFPSFLGASHNRTAHDPRLQPHLDDHKRKFWDKRLSPLCRRIGNFAHEIFGRSLRSKCVRSLQYFCGVARRHSSQLLRTMAQEEQAVLLQRIIAPLFDLKFVHATCWLRVTTYSLGGLMAQFGLLSAGGRRMTSPPCFWSGCGCWRTRR